MKSLALLYLIPYVLAYGGKPRKALPRTVPLKDDYESFGSESFWDHYGAKLRKAFPEPGLLENNLEDLADQNSFLPLEHDDYDGKKSPPKNYLLDDDIVEFPEIDPIFDSETGKNVFVGDEMNKLNTYSNDDSAFLGDFDRPIVQVTVPVDHSHRRKFGAFPKQEIKYQMGTKVLTDDVAVYIIYYGTWLSSQKDLLNDFTASLGDSTWWDIMRKYYFQKDIYSEKVYVTGKLSLGSTVNDNYSMGRKLDEDALPRLVRTHVENGILPKDSTGVYLILTSDDVQEEYRLGGASMCKDYCGYHLTGNFTDGSDFYYAMAGRPSACMSACGGPNSRSSPNRDPATDAMVSVIAHELAETVSDPDAEFLESRAWNDANYMENGDMCSYKYGALRRFVEWGRSSFFNYETTTGKKFLVQQNWDPELQKCVSFA